MSTAISREMITDCMKYSSTRCQRINRIICPAKELQPHRGVRLGKIVVTSEGCWSSIHFPQWVKLENSDSPGDWKSFRFHCTETGEFLSW